MAHTFPQAWGPMVFAMPTKCSQLNIQIKFTIKVYLTSGMLSVGGLKPVSSKLLPSVTETLYFTMKHLTTPHFNFYRLLEKYLLLQCCNTKKQQTTIVVNPGTV